MFYCIRLNNCRDVTANCINHCDLWLFLQTNIFDWPWWFFLSLIRQASMAQVPDWQGALPCLRRRLYESLGFYPLDLGSCIIFDVVPKRFGDLEYLEMYIAQAPMKIQSILGVSEKFGWKAWKLLGNQRNQTAWLGLGGFVLGTGSGHLHFQFDTALTVGKLITHFPIYMYFLT